MTETMAINKMTANIEAKRKVQRMTGSNGRKQNTIRGWKKSIQVEAESNKQQAKAQTVNEKIGWIDHTKFDIFDKQIKIHPCK
jgi:hypothetical protein